MKSKLKYLILAAIIILGVAYRFYKLRTIPYGAQVDEAHFGYMAYSLTETGRDERGTSWPLLFKGFGDDKLPLQTYLMMPAVKFFGLNNFSIRVVSALSGVGLILVIYFLAQELTKEETTSLAIAFLTALTPWSLILSRFGYESNLALLIFASSLLFLFKFINQKKKLFLWLSVIFMGLTWYAYIAYRLVTAIFLCSVLTILVLKKVIKLKFGFLLLISYLLLVSPFLIFHRDSNKTRFTQLFGNDLTRITLQINEQKAYCLQRLPKLVCNSFLNKGFILSKTLFNRFIKSFAPQYLIMEGEPDLPYLSVKDFGPFLLTAYILFLLGLAKIFNQKWDLKHFLLLIGTVLAPLPAVLVGDPQKVRLSALLVFLLAWSALGFSQLLKLIKTRQLKRIFIGLFVFFSLYLADSYYFKFIGVHTQKYDQDFVSYLPETLGQISRVDPEKLVVIKPFFSDPILYYAYYSQIDPQHYQQNVVLGELEESGFQHAIALDNLLVADVSDKRAACLGYEQDKQTVFVTDQEEKYPPIDTVKSINKVHDYVYFYDVSAKHSQQECQ